MGIFSHFALHPNVSQEAHTILLHSNFCFHLYLCTTSLHRRYFTLWKKPTTFPQCCHYLLVILPSLDNTFHKYVMNTLPLSLTYSQPYFLTQPRPHTSWSDHIYLPPGGNDTSIFLRGSLRASGWTIWTSNHPPPSPPIRCLRDAIGDLRLTTLANPTSGNERWN